MAVQADFGCAGSVEPTLRKSAKDGAPTALQVERKCGKSGAPGKIIADVELSVSPDYNVIELFFRTRPHSLSTLNPVSRSLPSLSVGSLAATNRSIAGDLFTASSNSSNITPEPTERRVPYEKIEYHEGKKAQEDFEEGMKALFQVPKMRPREKPARSGLKTLKVRPTNPLLPAILARLKAARAFSIRAAQNVCPPVHHR
ncbi:MAG: hypothetical protein ACJ71U_15080 [Terriglobales bacterium]